MLAERLGVARNTVARWEREEMGIPPYLNLALKDLRRDRSLAEYLRRVMEEERLTVHDVEHRSQKRGIKLSRSSVGLMLQDGIKNPGIETLKALAIGLGRPPLEVFRAAGVDAGEEQLEKSRFAEMAKNYASLPPKEKRALEAFITALEHAIKIAADR